MKKPIEFDGTLSIATGGSRKETHWKNGEILWSELVEKLAHTTVTHETMEEYLKAPKSRQDEIKDVGGFVGGVLTGGRRKADNVLERSMLTLDADHSKGGLWEMFELMFDCAGAVYSTHKHTPEKPRLRLVIPLSRPVDRDEYEAVGRKVASAIGIDDFDDTTFEPSRLMYWPSTPADGEFYFRYRDAEWLDPDEILAEYKDWTDSSSWAVSSRVNKVVRREMKKQADPTEKRGVVGAFCRTYSISEAIEAFLSDYYEPTGTEGRYTYLRGSTAGGLVVYEDKWGYSHHGTDPTSGQLCNAFDLVRLHLFGLMDEDADPRTNVTKLPSYKAMENLAVNDTRVKKLMISERMESAQEDFADVEVIDVESDWLEKLTYDKQKNIEPTPENIRLIMENDPNLKDLFGQDLFAKRIRLKRKPFWRTKDNSEYWNDADDAELRLYLGSSRYGINARNTIYDVFSSIASRQAFHPVRDYLDGLEWDGVPRLETLFIDSLGIEDSPYSRAITKLMLVGAVKRIYEPACFMDYVMVFVGQEGIGKSKMLNKLAVKDEWYAGDCPIVGKEAFENIRGKWIVEMAELKDINKRDSGTVKSFISKTSDYYRAAYDRYPQDQPRQCVFFGSGNDVNFLKGIGGDRRFLPVEVNEKRKKKNWDEYTDEDINNVYAEAKHYYEQGMKLMLPEEIVPLAREKQREHTETDAWEDYIDEFLSEEVPTNWIDLEEDSDVEPDLTMTTRDRVTVRDIWEKGFGERKPIDYVSQARIRKLMDRKPDWEYKVFRKKSKTFKGYVKKDVTAESKMLPQTKK